MDKKQGRPRRNTIVLDEATIKASTPLIDELQPSALADDQRSMTSDTTFDVDPDVQTFSRTSSASVFEDKTTLI